MTVALQIDYKDTPFKRWNFPGGEVGIKLENWLGKEDAAVAIQGIPTSDDIICMFNLLNALKYAGWPKSRVSVYMPYLPYARQDRVCTTGESFALEVFIQMLASQQDCFSYLLLKDVHSAAVKDLINKYMPDVEVFHVHQATLALQLPKFDAIIAPDKGAAEKANLIQPEAQHIYLTKVRQDGKVLYADLETDIIIGDVCIVDDICDGGRTFLSAAEMLDRTQPQMTSLSLYVTHGIFSAGMDVLTRFFDKVYCHNIMNPNTTGVEQV